MLVKQNKKCLWHLSLFIFSCQLHFGINQFHSFNKHLSTHFLSVWYMLDTMLDLRDEKMTMMPLKSAWHSEIQRHIKYTWFRTSRNLLNNQGQKTVYLENNQMSSCVLWMMRLKEGKWGRWGLEHSRKQLGEGDTSAGSVKGEEVFVYDHMCFKCRIFTTSH